MRRKTRRFLALALVCGMLFASSCGKNVEKEKAVTPTDAADISSGEVSSEYVQGPWFGPDDCMVNGIQPGMTVKEVKELLGKPISEYKVSDDEIQGFYIGLEYPGMTLSFDPEENKEFRLSHIYLREDNISLPNGLHIGNTLNEVVNAFDNPHRIRFGSESDFSDDWNYVYSSSRFIPDCFDPDWPDEPVQKAYCSDYKDDIAPLVYIYCEPPVWNADRTAYRITNYTLYFRTTPGDVRVTQIDIVKTTKLLSKGE